MSTVESPLPVTDARVANRERFELELEFVQSLANPFYLYSLAQQNILDQPAFVNYLEYLQYWREKDYARFIQSVWPGPLFNTDSNVLEVILMLCTIWSCFSTLTSGQR
ncbi:SOH1-domain-containing protein [Lanmaoa asiatica]|nr:SOH1-domain-containing protein [Lanmaoa asiatica]